MYRVLKNILGKFFFIYFLFFNMKLKTCVLNTSFNTAISYVFYVFVHQYVLWPFKLCLWSVHHKMMMMQVVYEYFQVVENKN